MTLIILMYALFASSFSIGKVLLTYTTPIFLTGIRMTIAGIILLAYQYFSPHEHFKIRKKHFWLYAQIIFFGVYANYILRFWALRDLTSSKTSFFYNLAPFFSAIYGYILFSEKISHKQLIGLVIGFLGLIPILTSTSPLELQSGEVFFISFAEICVIISVACHSYSWMVVRKLVHKKDYSPIMVSGITMTAGGICALITAYFVEGPIDILNPKEFFGWLFFVIIVSNIICHNLYGFLLKKYSPTFMSFAGFLTPLLTALYGWAFLKEQVTWQFCLSGVIVFGALLLFYQDELRRQHINQKLADQ
jgi:drug/metabolite transporter (DMT)-like permease